jgi:hypothetical protein
MAPLTAANRRVYYNKFFRACRRTSNPFACGHPYPKCDNDPYVTPLYYPDVNGEGKALSGKFFGNLVRKRLFLAVVIP